MKVEESFNMTFDETPPPPKTSPLEDDDLVEEEAIESEFLNGFINEEVYVAQPPGFIDFAKSNHVYRLKKALYGLKQAPKAWYDRLKAFPIKHDYTMGMVDNTLLTKKRDSNLIIVQIYVDDIIFESTCQELCDDFAKIMHDEFEMSMMGELNFFLGIQIKQLEDADRLANLGSPMQDSNLVTYAINGVRSSNARSNTMSTSGLDVCRNFQRSPCTYGARCKFVHGANDLRPHPNTTVSTSNNRSSNTRIPQNASNTNTAPKHIMQHNTHNSTNVSQPLPNHPTNMGYIYFHTGPGSYSPITPMQPPQAHMASTTPLQPAQQFHYSPFGPTSFNSPIMFGQLVTLQDYQTCWLFVRCDNTSDLYPVTQQPSSTITFSLLSLSPTTWHRRLGHPSEDVLRRLEPSCFISYNKTVSANITAISSELEYGIHGYVERVVRLKKDQEKDKIGSKPDKNGKRGEAKKSRKQLQ
nr:copia protein [Tanacetum cinerariifolium]